MSKTLKFGIIILAILCLALLALTLFELPGKSNGDQVVAETESTPQDWGDSELAEVVLAAIDQSEGWLPAESYIIDTIQYQDDGQVAAVWLAAIDPETGDLIGREPDLVMAEQDAEGKWALMVSGEEKFDDVLTEFQYASKTIQGDVDADQAPISKDAKVYGGYYLPWAENLTKRLTWSVSHTSCYPTYYCTHAFDFADGTMFPMVAAKGGTVYHWKDSCANGDSSCTNSITIQDRSTTPWTYQIYLHIAQGSIPANLKQVGAPVMQGQYIADVDDTGYSTGHHVHFMVVSEDTKYISTSGYVWGVALDITFKDVSINWDAATQGGRPRLEYEAATYGGEGQTYYTSGNAPANPPTGALTAPLSKTYQTDPLMTVSGWGQDDIAVTKLEILARYDEGDWVTIDEQTTTPFTAQVNLCDTEVPDGPFDLALRVWDYEGNPSSIVSVREVVKGVECSASVDPDVSLDEVGGAVLLPNSGQVSATVTKGSTNSNIVSVDFWFHGLNWNGDEWVLLGTDTNGADGWQAPFEAGSLGESTTYSVLAVATDALGNQGTDLTFKATLDKTPPWMNLDPLITPYVGDHYHLVWEVGDALSGFDRMDLYYRADGGEWVLLESNIPTTTTTFDYDVPGASYVEFRFKVYDMAGNLGIHGVGAAKEGYEFIFDMPIFYK
ncbi:MAG: M23 family metallopeptidase [Anaerolineaceae bacterium]|nr:M23 family metallopeptidase [Anaerolineaceae bacterium]